MSSCFSQPWSDSLIALGVQLGLGVPFCRWLQLFGVSERHVALLRLVTYFFFRWWPGRIGWRLHLLQLWLPIYYHHLPSITIINHISFSVCRSFATLLPRYGKRRTRWIVSSNPVPRIVPPSWTKSEDCNEARVPGDLPRKWVLYYPLVMTNIAMESDPFIYRWCTC